MNTAMASYTTSQQLHYEILRSSREVRNNKMNHQATISQKKHYGFAQIPRMILRGTYYQLSLIEKGLYACLKDICGEAGECFYALRNLAVEIGTSAATLSRYIPELRNKGLIYAEKRSRQNGHEIWYIRIVNIWPANDALYKLSAVSPDNADCFTEQQSDNRTQSIVSDRNTIVSDRNDQEVDQARDCFYLRANEYNKNTYINNNQMNDNDGDSATTSITIPSRISLLSSPFDNDDHEHEEEETPTAAISPLNQADVPLPPLTVREEKKPKRATRKRTTTTSEEKPASPRVRASSAKKEPVDLFTNAPQVVQAIILEWQSIFRHPMPVTEAMMKHAIALDAFEPVPGEIKACREWMYRMDTKGWYRSHGLDLGHVVREFAKWRSLREAPAPRSTANEPVKYASVSAEAEVVRVNKSPQLTREEQEKQAKLNAIKVKLLAEKQSPMQQQKGI